MRCTAAPVLCRVLPPGLDYERWSKALGFADSFKTVAEFNALRYTDPERFALLERYITDVENGKVSPSLGFAAYEQAAMVEGRTTKITDTGKVENPMPYSEYQKWKEALTKQGIEVFAAVKGDDLRYMQLIGAEGTYSHGRITHIGEAPSKGTLIEEIIHMAQARQYGELDSTDMIELFAREIEANRKLLKYKDLYGLDESDISDIRRNLSTWEKRYKKATGENYDENNYRGKM